MQSDDNSVYIFVNEEELELIRPRVKQNCKALDLNYKLLRFTGREVITTWTPPTE
jgi:hypothetical protein